MNDWLLLIDMNLEIIAITSNTAALAKFEKEKCVLFVKELQLSHSLYICDWDCRPCCGFSITGVLRQLLLPRCEISTRKQNSRKAFLPFWCACWNKNLALSSSLSKHIAKFILLLRFPFPEFQYTPANEGSTYTVVGNTCSSKWSILRKEFISITLALG